MNYVICLSGADFCRQIDETSAIRLASVSGLFASFKWNPENQLSRQSPLVFNVHRCFSWQMLDVFLGMFSPPGRNLIPEVDNLVEFINICCYFKVSEPFVTAQFRVAITREYPEAFRDNQFCEILFALKTSRYTTLALDLITYANNEFADVFRLNDLLAARLVADFRELVESRFEELE